MQFNLSEITRLIGAEWLEVSESAGAITVLNARGIDVAEAQRRIDRMMRGEQPQTSITPRQAKLALYGAGLLDRVEEMVAQADKVVQIHYAESVVWYRDDPVLNGLAGALGLSAEQLDALFEQASKL